MQRYLADKPQITNENRRGPFGWKGPRAFFGRLLDLTLPRTCAACEAPLGSDDLAVCSDCEPAFETAALPLRIGQTSDLLVHPVLLHEGPGRELIHALKYRGRRDVARFLAQRAASLYPELFRPGTILIPIPLHPRRERARGYNQSTLLAQALAKVVPGVEVRRRTLVRIRSTLSQTHLDRPARHTNVAGAFRLRNREAVAGRPVILVDDVVTTGATLEAAAAPLLAASPTMVAALVAGHAELT